MSKVSSDMHIREDSYGTQRYTHSGVLNLLKVSKPQELASTSQACSLLYWSIYESPDDQVRIRRKRESRENVECRTCPGSGPWHVVHVHDYQTPAVLTGLCHLAA